MARPGPQTYAKRLREQAKKEKRLAKEEKKALRKAQKLAETSPDESATDAPVSDEASTEQV